MYKKYIHPVYDFYNEEYKQLDENRWISSKGKIITAEEIAEEVKHDQEKIDSGEYITKLTEYGLLDSTEQEFIIAVYDKFEDLSKTIVSTNIEIAKLKQITGVYFEI